MEYKLDDIVVMKKQHPCKKSNKWQIIRMGADIKVKCLGCGAVVMFSRSNFKKKLQCIVSESKQEVKLPLLNKKSTTVKNSKFKKLDNDHNRLSKQIGLYHYFTDIGISNEFIFNLQLIDSANNHVTKSHHIQNRIVKIIYKTKDHLYKVFQYKCHYCLNCHCYFDFYQSFLIQLEMNNIAMKDLILRINKELDYNSSLKMKANTNIFDEFNSESFLHALGYKVGMNGLSRIKRQQLLDIVINHKIMTIYEIKSTISNNIRMFARRKGYEIAIKEWEEDLDYLNNKIK